jgi:hypothetical protein
VLAAIIAALGLGAGLVTSIWRGGSKMGALVEKLEMLSSSTNRRLTELEDHVHEHDQWHMSRIEHRVDKSG